MEASYVTYNRENSEFYKSMEMAQRGLSWAQSTPIVGPMAVSPIKALASSVQFAVSFVFIPLFGLGAIFQAMCLAENENESETFCYQMLDLVTDQTLLGFGALAYSISNMLTLGALGFYIERVAENPKTWTFHGF